MLYLFGSIDEDGSCAIDYREFAATAAEAGLATDEVNRLRAAQRAGARSEAAPA